MQGYSKKNITQNLVFIWCFLIFTFIEKSSPIFINQYYCFYFVSNTITQECNKIKKNQDAYLSPALQRPITCIRPCRQHFGFPRGAEGLYTSVVCCCGYITGYIRCRIILEYMVIQRQIDQCTNSSKYICFPLKWTTKTLSRV